MSGSVDGIEGIYHINLNCRDFETSLAFYKKLGFEVVMHFPAASNEEMGRGLGVSGQRMFGALLRLGTNRLSARLDLLQWTSPAANNDAAAAVQDLGFVRLALWCSAPSFDSVVDRLRASGIAFIADPVRIETGAEPVRFVCFQDPDGNIVELVARPAGKDAGKASAPRTDDIENLTGMGE
jgi:catechol 2,3-dioxygenase-like lactoylglutathione lyase family enzyme